jgi:hypothetical protein
MANAMIDLGEVQPEVTALGGRPPVPWRALLGALSVVLLALVAGSAATVPLPAPKVIPARLGEATFLNGNRLFLATSGPAVFAPSALVKIINAYSIPGGQLLSRTTVEVSGAVSNVIQAGDTLIVTYQRGEDGDQGTVAVTVGTDRELWRRLDGLAGVSEPAGLALLNTGYGVADQAPNQAPNQAAWQAIDLHTGQPRWSIAEPTGGHTFVAGAEDAYPQWFVSVHADGRLEARDALTGRILTQRDGPPIQPHADTVIWSVGDLAIIGGQTGGVTAYRLPGLTPVWTTRADLSQTSIQTDCGTVLCAFRPQQGIIVLDRADGHQLWQSNRWTDAAPVGDYLIAALADRAVDAPAYWVLDPRTGRVLGNFGNWEPIGAGAAPGSLYGIHLVPGQSTLLYGVLDSARRTATILGRGEAVFGSCESSAGALVCRLNDASVAIWRLR